MMLSIGNIRYQITNQKLGHGSFGKVLLAEGSNGSKIALKEQTAKDKFGKSIIDTEYELHKELSDKVDCHHVIKMIGRQEVADTTYFALELAERTLYRKTILQKVNPRLVRHYFQQVVAGVKFIHENQIVHRDLKPGNILVTSGDVVKISDFGTASRFVVGDLVPDSVGTREFSAPELGHGGFVSGPPVDIFAIGVTLMQMAAGSSSSWENCTDPMYDRWVKGETVRGDIWKNINKDILSLLRQMIRSDYSTRATINDIEKNEWFRGYTSGHLRLKPKQKKRFDNSDVATKPMKRRKIDTIDSVQSSTSIDFSPIPIDFSSTSIVFSK